MFRRVVCWSGWFMLLLGLSLIRRADCASAERDEGRDDNEDNSSAPTPIDRDTYLAHRQSTQGGADEAQQNLDKALLTLSAGAFGLSIAFVSQVVPPAQGLGLLFISWVAFGASIIFELFSFVSSKRAHERDVELLDEDYVAQSGEERYSRWNAATKGLNLLAGMGFATGTVLLVLFVTRNVV